MLQSGAIWQANCASVGSPVGIVESLIDVLDEVLNGKVEVGAVASCVITGKQSTLAHLFIVAAIGLQYEIVALQVEAQFVSCTEIGTCPHTAIKETEAAKVDRKAVKTNIVWNW